jgi:hypothetical protein
MKDVSDVLFVKRFACKSSVCGELWMIQVRFSTSGSKCKFFCVVKRELIDESNGLDRIDMKMD